ncbi:MAG: hypothetical protein U5K81_09960 [Trueperaceae bacterium]|nr:hypothetical protein [Trueperaceae bacterium]
MDRSGAQCARTRPPEGAEMDDRTLYQQKMQARLDSMKAEVDRLEAKASEADADAKLELNRRIEALKSRIDDGRSKLTELSQASGDAWESVRKGVDDAMTSLGEAFEGAKDAFRR